MEVVGKAARPVQREGATISAISVGRRGGARVVAWMRGSAVSISACSLCHSSAPRQSGRHPLDQAIAKNQLVVERAADMQSEKTE